MNSIENVLNLNYMGRSSISMSKAVLLLYLIISNNYTDNLLSGQLREFIKNNRYAQHFIGYITMLVIINVLGGVSDPQMAALYSLIGYLWFIFTTKLDLSWNLLIIGVMVIALLYENTMMDKEIQSRDDQALEESDKKKIRNRHNRVKTLIIISILVITVIGTALYFNKKQVQYGGNFDSMKYVFG